MKFSTQSLSAVAGFEGRQSKSAFGSSGMTAGTGEGEGALRAASLAEAILDVDLPLREWDGRSSLALP